MTIFPEFLYRLTPRDEQVTPLDMINFDFGVFSDTSASLMTTASYTVPDGKIFALTSATVFLEGGAAQFPKVWSIIMTYGGTSFYVSGGTLPCIAAANFSLGSTTAPYFCQPGSVITLGGEFNAGVNANNIGGSINGILIPRGNFAI